MASHDRSPQEEVPGGWAIQHDPDLKLLLPW
jgi:hypothetical protein